MLIEFSGGIGQNEIRWRMEQTAEGGRAFCGAALTGGAKLVNDQNI
jgi:hypothetical protein